MYIFGNEGLKVSGIAVHTVPHGDYYYIQPETV